MKLIYHDISNGKWETKDTSRLGLGRCKSIVIKTKDANGNDCDFAVARGITNDANANLIASAPEMLEMLKELHDRDDIYYKIKSVGARARLRQVIAKAEDK